MTITSRHRRTTTLILGFTTLMMGPAAAIAAPAADEPAEEAAPAADAAEAPAPAPASRPERAAKPEGAAAASTTAPVQPPQPPPDNVPPIPATAVSTGETAAPAVPGPYIQHLGPDSFPGRLRGLYGGSLWLEPSFDGLQWPYMAHTGVGVSGYLWMDSGRELINRENGQIPNSALWYQQGRGVLRLTPTYAGDNLFIQGQIELAGNMCQSAGATNIVCLAAGTFDTDDLWLRVGQWNRWDLKVGRFEGWEVYHVGMGMEQYTFSRLGARNFGVQTFTDPPLEAPLLYGVSFLHDRPTDGLAAGYAALHLYPSDWLRFEVLGKLGTDNNVNDNSTGDTPTTSFGARPVAILDVGWLKVKLGAEYQKAVPITQTVQPGTPGMKVEAAAKLVQKGVGGSVQVIVNPIAEFGISAAIADQHRENGFAQVIPAETFTTKSVGGFANVRVCELCLLGLGLHYTAFTDSVLAMNSTVNDFSSQWQGFASFQVLLAGQLFIRPEFNYARAFFQPSDVTVSTWNNNMYDVKVRLMYLY
jgi:hypothetical protein